MRSIKKIIDNVNLFRKINLVVLKSFSIFLVISLNVFKIFCQFSILVFYALYPFVLPHRVD